MRYLIWAWDHEAWYRPNRAGYTTEVHQAGRYTKEEAGDIVTDAIWPPGELVAVTEKVAIMHGPPPVILGRRE